MFGSYCFRTLAVILVPDLKELIIIITIIITYLFYILLLLLMLLKTCIWTKVFEFYGFAVESAVKTVAKIVGGSCRRPDICCRKERLLVCSQLPLGDVSTL